MCDRPDLTLLFELCRSLHIEWENNYFSVYGNRSCLFHCILVFSHEGETRWKKLTVQRIIAWYQVIRIKFSIVYHKILNHAWSMKSCTCSELCISTQRPITIMLETFLWVWKTFWSLVEFLQFWENEMRFDSLQRECPFYFVECCFCFNICDTRGMEVEFIVTQHCQTTVIHIINR